MSYTGTTSHYQLPQWQSSAGNKPSWMTDVNLAFRTLDEKLFEADSTANAASGKASSNEGRLDTLEISVNAQGQDITTLKQSASSNTTAIGQLQATSQQHTAEIAELQGEIQPKVYKRTTSFYLSVSGTITKLNGKATYYDGVILNIPSIEIGSAPQPYHTISIDGVTYYALAKINATANQSKSLSDFAAFDGYYGYANRSTGSVNQLGIVSALIGGYSDESVYLYSNLNFSTGGAPNTLILGFMGSVYTGNIPAFELTSWI